MGLARSPRKGALPRPSHVLGLDASSTPSYKRLMSNESPTGRGAESAPAEFSHSDLTFITNEGGNFRIVHANRA